MTTSEKDFDVLREYWPINLEYVYVTKITSSFYNYYIKVINENNALLGHKKCFPFFLSMNNIAKT